MFELFALYFACRNIGVIARSRGVRATQYQMQAITLWVVFELGFVVIAAKLGLNELVCYLAAIVGGLLSLHFSFKAVRAVRPRRPQATPTGV